MFTWLFGDVEKLEKGWYQQVVIEPSCDSINFARCSNRLFDTEATIKTAIRKAQQLIRDMEGGYLPIGGV